MNHISRWQGLHFFENKTNGKMKPIGPRKEEKTIVPCGGREPALHQQTTKSRLI
jgi:hypothetical protein